MAMKCLRCGADSSWIDGNKRSDDAAEINRLRTQLAEAERARDLAIAHDRQPYPTADAYERVCASLKKWRGRAETAESQLAESERKRESAEARVAVLAAALKRIAASPHISDLPAIVALEGNEQIALKALTAPGVEVLARDCVFVPPTDGDIGDWCRSMGQLGTISQAGSFMARLGVPCLVIRTNQETADEPA